MQILIVIVPVIQILILLYYKNIKTKLFIYSCYFPVIKDTMTSVV